MNPWDEPEPHYEPNGVMSSEHGFKGNGRNGKPNDSSKRDWWDER
jgi:hypothetical protein